MVGEVEQIPQKSGLLLTILYLKWLYQCGKFAGLLLEENVK